jgi:hypothetical protein
MLARSLFAAGLLAGACTAQAQVIFSDNFNADTQGLNKTTFVNGWTVTNGTVDVIGTGFFDLYPGQGNYVDLDGSMGDAGVFGRSLSLTGGETYTASFLLGGSQRGDTNIVNVMFGTTMSSFTLLSNDPLGARSIAFTPGSTGSYVLSFANVGGDNLGAILDDVAVRGAVAAIPEPETYALMLAGLGAVGFIARRRKQGSGRA